MRSCSSLYQRIAVLKKLTADKKLLTEKRSGDNIQKFAAENSRRGGRANDPSEESGEWKEKRTKRRKKDIDKAETAC